MRLQSGNPVLSASRGLGLKGPIINRRKLSRRGTGWADRASATNRFPVKTLRPKVQARWATEPSLSCSCPREAQDGFSSGSVPFPGGNGACNMLILENRLALYLKSKLSRTAYTL